ncbi:MAG: hypothetical protein R2856_35250 [Caldilineaceae bacterium]
MAVIGMAVWMRPTRRAYRFTNAFMIMAMLVTPLLQNDRHRAGVDAPRWRPPRPRTHAVSDLTAEMRDNLRRRSVHATRGISTASRRSR